MSVSPPVRGPRVLVAGAAGRLGRELVRALVVQGYRVRVLTRAPELPAVIRDLVESHVVDDVTTSLELLHACREVEAVVSAVGASLRAGFGHGRRSFRDVDREGNVRLLQAAERAGVGRYAWISPFGGRELVHAEYAWAHESVVDRIVASRLAPLVVRPTVLFHDLEPVLRRARRGPLLMLGEGGAAINPVHQEDVARAVARALAEGVEELNMGGPETFTRREIRTLALDAWGRSRGPVISVPSDVVRRAGRVLRPFHPRLGGLLEWRAVDAAADRIAPVWGKRTLGEYFEERVEEMRGHGRRGR